MVLVAAPPSAASVQSDTPPFGEVTLVTWASLGTWSASRFVSPRFTS